MKKMGLLEELQSKRKDAQVEKAKEFVGYIKPRLIESAEKGYKGFTFKVEKEDRHLYSSDTFVDYLNENLEGVKVEYRATFFENLFVKGRGYYEHELHFTW